jgi:hypothetical protein
MKNWEKSEKESETSDLTARESVLKSKELRTKNLR